MIFNDLQLMVINALADGIFPRTDHSPAASDLPVSELFIDVAKTWSDDVITATASSLEAVNDISLSIFYLPVYELDVEDISTVISIVANSSSLREFWEPFRVLITISYYALPSSFDAMDFRRSHFRSSGFAPAGYPA